MSSENDVTVVMDEAEFSLADLAGVDLGTIEAYRQIRLPVGKYHFRINDAGLGHVEVPLDYNDPDSEKVNRPAINFELVVQTCFALVDPKLDPGNFIDQKHTVSFRIKDMKKDLGKVVAFIQDIKMEANGPITEVLDAAHGYEFVSDVTHGRNTKNPDFPFINLKNQQTLEEFAEEQQEG